MTAPIHLAFVWRLHQPWGLSPDSGSLLLPWVRLHAASTYRDLTTLMERHPAVRATMVLSPSLLDQIRFLREGVEDNGLTLTRVPADELTPEERGMLARYFFSVHRERHLLPVPRYRELLDKRGPLPPEGAWGEAASRFDVDELRDLQLLFNLSWLGFTAAEDDAVRALLDQGRGYTEADKEVVLARQFEMLEGLVPACQALAERGSVEWIPCPHRYPVLPLLMDTHTALRPLPEARLPGRFAAPQDAAEQVARARRRYTRELGWAPKGLWPPELAISPETVKMAGEQGFSYLVADASVLFHSLDERGGSPGPRRLHQAYQVGDCSLVFRDSDISELLASEYANWQDADAAVDHFVARVQAAGDSARLDDDAPPLVTVALPAEGPWEAYPQRGQAFLQALFGRLSDHERIRTVTLSEHLEAHPPATSLDYLHSGSWLGGNFAIWIGEPTKNRAWNLLGQARARLERARLSAEVGPDQLASATDSLLAAEGADWFRWLGEPYHSEEDDLYEAVFRAHLAAVYRNLGDTPPADLFRRLAHGGVVSPSRSPTSHIHPRMDGLRTSYFEWRGAGFYRPPPARSLHSTPAILSGLYWGFDPGRLYLRLESSDALPGDLSPLGPSLETRLKLTGPGRRIEARLVLDEPHHLLLKQEPGDDHQLELGWVQEVQVGEVIEAAIPLSRLGLRPGEVLGLSVHFSRDGESIARVPSQGVIEVEVPAGAYEVGPSFRI